MLPEGKKIIIEIFFLRRRTLNENRKQRTFGPAGSLVTAEMQFPQALDGMALLVRLEGPTGPLQNPSSAPFIIA